MGLDHDDFRALFDQEGDRIHRFLLRLTGNRDDAQELTQDAFVAVWRARSRFEGRGSAAGYLRRTAFRLFLNRYRRVRRRRRLAPAPGTAESAIGTDSRLEQAEAREFLLDRLREALARLPRALCEAFVLFRMQGLCVAEIAETIGVPRKTVETRIRRATLALASALHRYRHLMAG